MEERKYIGKTIGGGTGVNDLRLLILSHMVNPIGIIEIFLAGVTWSLWYGVSPLSPFEY